MQVTLDYEKITNTVELMEASGYSTSSILKAVRKIHPKTALGRAWTWPRLKSSIGNHKKRTMQNPGQKMVEAAFAPQKLSPQTHEEVVEIVGNQDWETNVLSVMGMPLPLGVKKDIVKLLCFKEV